MQFRAVSRTVETILIATAYLLPLIVLPSLIQDAAGLPKSVVLALSTALLCGAGLARIFIYRKPLCPNTPVIPPLLALLGVSAVSLVNTPAPGAGIHHLLYLAALVTATLMAASLPVRNRVLSAVMIAAGLTALYGVAQFMGFEPLPWSPHFKPRIFATMGNPVFLGGFLAAVFPIVFARWLYVEREETKDLLVLLLALLATAIYLTWTRSAWFALVVSTVLQLALLVATGAGRRLLAANRAWLLTGAVLALIAVTLISSVRMFGKTPVPLADRIRDAFDPQAYSVQFRRVTGESCLRLAIESPIVGIGPNAFFARYPFVRLKTKAAAAAPEHFFASQELYAHNDHAQILAESGVLGFGVWIWLLICAFRWAWYQHRADESRPDGDSDEAGYPLGAIGCIGAVCADGAFNFPLHIDPTAWVFFLAMGLLGAGNRNGPIIAGALPGSWRRLSVAVILITVCGALVVRPAIDALKADRMLLEGDRQVSYNNYEMAAVYYGLGVAAAPFNRFLRFRFSVATMQSGRWEWRGHALDKSLADAQVALALGYHDENVYKHISDIFGKKGDIAKAIAALRTSHLIHPRREDVMNNLAYYMIERGEDADEALALARKAVSRAPEDPTYLDTLGWILYKTGRIAEARKVLARALKNIPKESVTPNHAAARREIIKHIKLARNASRRN